MGYNGSERQKENALAGSRKAKVTASQARLHRITVYNGKPKLCTAGCGISLPYEKQHQLFCSRACSSTFNNVLKGRKRRKEEPPKHPYGRAGNPAFNQHVSEALKAMWATRRVEQLKLWKVGQLHPSNNTAKQLLIFEHDQKCSICGWGEMNPFSKTTPVELEHRDGDCYNNTYENVCLLCPNHHALTPTFRGLNAGKGRGRKFYKVVSQWAKEHKMTGIWSDKREMVPPTGVEPATLRLKAGGSTS